jgi:signal transduction histidine kinase/CheY-like chemotaxis protein/HAMP domain-containing protein
MGEMLELKDTINTMVDQLRSFAAEVTRVAREVGTEGKLGGQADVRGVAGTWKDLTDSVNSMAGNLTSQVRGIAKVVTAVANGDLKQQLSVDAKGEIAALADTINSMIQTLATFADQVTTVAREVGVEGKLGGQAKVPGAAGTWKDLTENVNQLAANLTTQVRAIAEVATAVTKGDLTRSIAVEAQGEVAALKDTINEMIRNLRDTTRKNTEQNWLKTNLAKFSRMLQGQRDLTYVGRMILSELAPVVSAQHAVFFVLDGSREPKQLTLLASYGYKGTHALGGTVELGEGLVGQCALEKRVILLSKVPRDYIRIRSGLGAAPPENILVLPIIFEGDVKGVIELASFERFSAAHESFLEQLTESIGIVLNTIAANMRTEDLLQQSQSLARELQSQQEELQKTNEQLQEKARLLADQNEEVERKNKEVEQARQALEEKAKQLALTSKYKSEFLANMSHELRTPLNSLLILSDQLSKNSEGNLTAKQREFSKTIHSSGNDLLTLINDILDLSKIESGTVIVDIGEIRLDDLRAFVERTFRHLAEAKNVGFSVEVDREAPLSLVTDAKRLQQVLKNLLSNAFKFTHQGQVILEIKPALSGWSPDHDNLNRASSVIAFSVRDTGIGIPADKQQIIFEAFQQADGSTSRKYGGTGLGRAISRELSQLLGGEIRLSSTPGRGSTFTLYLPDVYPPRSAPWSQNAGDRPSLFTPREPLPQQKPSFPAEVEPDGFEVQAVGQSLESMPTVFTDEVGDDRRNIVPQDKVLLIIENDLSFARFLLDAAREKGFKGIVTPLGTAGLALTREYQPQAITLDLSLPDVDGWRVLDRLKNDITRRHIPVSILSTEESCRRGFQSGVFDFLQKPIEKRETLDCFLERLRRHLGRTARNVLLWAGDPGYRKLVVEHLRNQFVQITEAESAEIALASLGEDPLDCVVAGPEEATADNLNRLATPLAKAGLQHLPVIVYEHQNLARSDDLSRVSDFFTVRYVHSQERLIDQVALFLHIDVSRLDQEKQAIVSDLHQSDRVLAGRKVLIVDDDMRNIFALSALLEEHDMNVLAADNGRDTILLLKRQPDIEMVLMDIMMPEMDGIETMQEIRRIPQFKNVPIIAVTAKAMKGDREKCIEAGAWDYLAKPVDPAELFAVMRAWLHR